MGALGAFGRFLPIVHGCAIVVHTTTYYQVLHEKPLGTHTVPGIHGGVHSIIRLKSVRRPEGKAKNMIIMGVYIYTSM